MKTILEIKFTHRKIKSWEIALPFKIYWWRDVDLIEVTRNIDDFFKNNKCDPLLKGDYSLSRSMFKETWRVYLEES